MIACKCDFIRCENPATAKGHVYGHRRGEIGKGLDRFIPVNACDKHKSHESFFEDTAPKEDKESETSG